ncbi:hypothetical protein EL17_02485 [Anditalea andensis]|uniref:Uncharacterized protein n=1 Tax=Anditalea andensis TaxID=1048983 RepID=A0A074KX62_9BACT|nr:hypothetical protein EL17_02485 [Anditalea andensis]
MRNTKREQQEIKRISFPFHCFKRNDPYVKMCFKMIFYSTYALITYSHFKKLVLFSEGKLYKLIILIIFFERKKYNILKCIFIKLNSIKYTIKLGGNNIPPKKLLSF